LSAGWLGSTAAGSSNQKLDGQLGAGSALACRYKLLNVNSVNNVLITSNPINCAGERAVLHAGDLGRAIPGLGGLEFQSLRKIPISYYRRRWATPGYG
jgi:hypothetical protein